ncbi:MAG: DUF1207 domain-containing protein [Planctomycetota bacterium]
MAFDPWRPNKRGTGRLRTLLAALVVAFGSVAASADSDPFLQSSFYGPQGETPRVALASDRLAVGSEAVLNESYAIDPEFEGNDAAEITLAGYGQTVADGYRAPSGGYRWRILPDGLIYRSYLAGPREPRISSQFFDASTPVQSSELLWDGTVGGRRGLVRYGTRDPLRPEGFQVDIEGAATVRLNLDEDRDLDASDFRFGVPVTWRSGNVQYKTGYYHVSSHLGDELILRQGENTRVNYVRDAILFGVSYNPAPAWRIYGETAYAVFIAGGAQPWEFQFGVEYVQPGVTGPWGTPFAATNAHLREEIDFGGDWTTQLGWLWRGKSGSTFRLGLHYVNGKSTQYQFFDRNEEQIGFGAWYDF